MKSWIGIRSTCNLGHWTITPHCFTIYTACTCIQTVQLLLTYIGTLDLSISKLYAWCAAEKVVSR